MVIVTQSLTIFFYFKQVSADANDGTVDQVSLSNNGTSVGEERTIDCVNILFETNNINYILIIVFK